MSGWSPWLKSSGKTPSRDEHHRRHRRQQRRRSESRPPAPSASAGRAARCLLTSATLSPASGPNSGPTTIAPTIRIGWSSTMPDGRDLHRGDHVEQEAERQLGVLGGARLDLLPDDRVRRQAGRRLLGGDRGRREREVDRPRPRSSRSSGSSSSLRSPISTLAVLARDVAEDHVAVRLARGALQVDDVDHRRRGAEQIQHALREIRAARRCAGGPSGHRRSSGASVSRTIGRQRAAAHRLRVDAYVAQLALDQRASVVDALDRERGRGRRRRRAA